MHWIKTFPNRICWYKFSQSNECSGLDQFNRLLIKMRYKYEWQRSDYFVYASRWERSRGMQQELYTCDSFFKSWNGKYVRNSGVGEVDSVWLVDKLIADWDKTWAGAATASVLATTRTTLNKMPMKAPFSEIDRNIDRNIGQVLVKYWSVVPIGGAFQRGHSFFVRHVLQILLRHQLLGWNRIETLVH